MWKKVKKSILAQNMHFLKSVVFVAFVWFEAFFWFPFVIFFSRVIGHFVDRVILKNERGYGIGYFFTVIFAQVILGILASTIVCWFSRRREFRADYGGAQLTSKASMINSLKVLQKMSAAKLPDQMLAFGISNRGNQGTVRKLFSTHPPISDRIAALEQANISEYAKQHMN